MITINPLIPNVSPVLAISEFSLAVYLWISYDSQNKQLLFL
jgi:hypothetical protein